jgi:hypothetical protein
MADFVQNGTKVLDYARTGLEQSPRTRILVQRGPQGIRFIDPPLAGTQLGRRILFRFAFQTVVILIVVPVFFTVWGFSRAGILIGVIGFAAYNGWFLLRYWRHSGRYPTVIDITLSAMAVTLPSRKRIFLPFGEIGDIHASRPRRQFGVRGRVSSLVISAWGRKFWLLRCRDYVEVRWLARQIRLSVGRAPDHPGEPTARIVADTQEHWEPESVWSGPLPAMPQSGEAARSCTRKTFRQVVWREYDNLGCVATLFLFLSIIIGCFIITRLVGDLIICLQFGADAYFQQGLRFVPHHGSLLTNGRRIGQQYQILSVVLSGAGMIAWTALVVPIVIGFNRLCDAIRGRRQREQRTKLQR